MLYVDAVIVYSLVYNVYKYKILHFWTHLQKYQTLVPTHLKVHRKNMEE